MIRLVFALLAGFAALTGGSDRAQAQAGYDRPGGDYSSFAVRSGDPAACAARCDRESRCQAWSFSYPATGASAVCWLKSDVRARIENDCCNSGVRGTGVIELRSGGLEHGIDRLGGDYRNFEVPPDPAGKACAAACQGDAKCRAWTYVRPGYIGSGARCFLKNAVKPPRRKPYAISGVIR